MTEFKPLPHTAESPHASYAEGRSSNRVRLVATGIVVAGLALSASFIDGMFGGEESVDADTPEAPCIDPNIDPGIMRYYPPGQAPELPTPTLI